MSDKDRHTAHISELEKAQARERLVQALSDLNAVDRKIQSAMAILGMEEN